MGPIDDTKARRPITITRRQFGFVVNPGTFTVDTDIGLGEYFVLRNRTRVDVSVAFPPGAVSDEGGLALTEPFSLAAGKDVKLTVNTKYKDSWFEYSVTMASLGIEAAGNSRPGVEIVP